MCALDSVGMQCVLMDPSAHGGRQSECDHEHPPSNQQEIQPMGKISQEIHIKQSVPGRTHKTYTSLFHEYILGYLELIDLIKL